MRNILNFSRQEKKREDVIVRLGDWNVTEPDETKYQDFEIKSIEKHDKYCPATEQHDILLIKLDRSVEYTQYIRPLCLPSIDITPDQTIYVAGTSVEISFFFHVIVGIWLYN